MANIKLNNQQKRVEIKSFEIKNDIVFNYFSKLQEKERDDKFLRAIYIGVLAMMEDRLSAFLSKTQNELGTELESLKMIFDMKMELFYKSTVKGTLAENDIAEVLNEYLENKKINDKVILTGNSAGNIHRNKTGDIVCNLDGTEEKRIVIECKFDKSIGLGDIEKKDVFLKNNKDTAWSQLIEAQANRQAQTGIIVFDISVVDKSIINFSDNVGFIPEIGFICVIDSQRGDYTNLFIAYMLARDIVLKAKNINYDEKILSVMITRIIKNMNNIKSIREMVEGNISNNMKILKQIEKAMLLIELDQEYLNKFLTSGILTKEDMLNYYSGVEIRTKYKSIESEIDQIIK